METCPCVKHSPPSPPIPWNRSFLLSEIWHGMVLHNHFIKTTELEFSTKLFFAKSERCTQMYSKKCLFLQKIWVIFFGWKYRIVKTEKQCVIISFDPILGLNWLKCTLCMNLESYEYFRKFVKRFCFTEIGAMIFKTMNVFVKLCNTSLLGFPDLIS